MPEDADTIEAHLKESRSFPPPQGFSKHAHVQHVEVYEEARKDPERFWAGWAAELEWSKEWDTVLEWESPFAKWFVGGKLNVAVNCVDRHVAAGRGDKVAFYWEGEPGDTRTMTYAELKDEVCRFAAGLRSLGVQKGDRVTMYLPMVLELPIAMLACARIGAIHNVVFGGFSPKAVAERMLDSGSAYLVTCDKYYRAGKTIRQKERADEAAGKVKGLRHVVVVSREGEQGTSMHEGRDHWWHELVQGQPVDTPAEPMDSEDTLFLMYTSGTTGKPKGILHTTAGYLTGTYATTKWTFDLKDDDIYWCMADIGWITGHSYIVYGPLANGATQVMYEGAPMHPEPDRAWAIAEKYKTTILYTAPTAIRAFMKMGKEHPRKHDLSTLRLLGTVGEPINPEAWMWYHEQIGGKKAPVVDTWWQTETGMHMITPLPGITTTVPGSATKPFPGIDAAVVDQSGKPVPPGRGGLLVIRKPWPAMLRTIWGDDQRYIDTYWSKFDGRYYYAGDGARIDEDGNFWIMGRIDDVLNVSGHRLSTMEIESTLVGHDNVAEAAVVGAKDDLKGHVPVAFVIVAAGQEDSEALHTRLMEHIVQDIGPIAKPRSIVVVPDLPKTRSGKIMRRLLVDICEGRELGDTTTLADPEVAAEIKKRYDEQVAATEAT